MTRSAYRRQYLQELSRQAIEATGEQWIRWHNNEALTITTRHWIAVLIVRLRLLFRTET